MKRKTVKEGELLPSRQPVNWRSDVSSALSPARLSRILDNLSSGQLADAMSLFDAMEEKDLHIGAVTQTRSLAVTARKRKVEPASESAHDNAVADFVERAIAGIPRFSSTLTGLMSAVTHGFSMVEIIWKVSDGAVLVDQLLARPQRLFTFSDNTGELLDFPAYVDPITGKNVELPRKKFIYHSTGGVRHPVESGIYRGISWSYLFANYTLKDWMTFMDLYGIPLRLGKYRSTADDNAKDVLKNAVLNLGSDAAAVISEDTTIEFVHSALSGDHALFENAIEHFNRQISKRILGQTLTTDSGGKKGGAYALGKVHDRVRGDIVMADISNLDETINHDLVRPLVDFNFGPQKDYPRLVTELEGSGIGAKP